MAADSNNAYLDYWTLVDPVWDLIDIYNGPKRFLESFARVRPEVANLYAAHYCQSEVCNGGFWQFFFNNTGVLAPEAILGLRALGLGATANVVSEAVAQFQPIYPRARLTRGKALDKLGVETFKTLDERFFQLIDSECGGFNAAADAYASGIAA